MIQPTVGRVVHYFRDRDSEAQVALIAHVNDDGTVNLAVFDHNGTPEPRPSHIPLVQEGEVLPLQGHYCGWMAYQKGQAAKTEALEAQISSASTGLQQGEVSFHNENTGFGGVFTPPVPTLTEVVGNGGTFDGGGASGDYGTALNESARTATSTGSTDGDNYAGGSSYSSCSSDSGSSSSSSDSGSSSSSDSGSSGSSD